MMLLFVEVLSSFGLVGGVPLIADPTGALLGFPLGGTNALSSFPIPIHDFFLPGLWLFFGLRRGICESYVSALVP